MPIGSFYHECGLVPVAILTALDGTDIEIVFGELLEVLKGYRVRGGIIQRSATQFKAFLAIFYLPLCSIAVFRPCQVGGRVLNSRDNIRNHTALAVLADGQFEARIIQITVVFERQCMA